MRAAAEKEKGMGGSWWADLSTPKKRLIGLVGSFAVGLLLLKSMNGAIQGSDASHSDQEEQYNVVIDAGSSGSRVHAYKFSTGENGLVLEEELFEQLKPGLSSYKGDPDGAASSLVPLLASAIKFIPAKLQKRTAVSLKATAGLRMLGEEEAEKILARVSTLLSTYPFEMQGATKQDVGIMSGLDEAFFAWVTINYLMGLLEKDAVQTACMLDLGGGSTQIAISTPIPAKNKGNAAGRHHGHGGSHGMTRFVMGQERRMFLHSYLGFGLLAGRAQVFALEGSSSSEAESQAVNSPCIASGDNVVYPYNGRTWTVTGTGADFEQCNTQMQRLIRQSGNEFADTSSPVPPARPAPGQPIFAMSYYFDVAVDVGLISASAEQAELSPADYTKKAREICGTPTASVKTQFPELEGDRASYLCMDLTFIQGLLQDGFGIAPDAQVNLAKAMRFNGARVETQWTLGAALDIMGRQMHADHPPRGGEHGPMGPGPMGIE